MRIAIEDITEKFLRYVKYDTQSDATSTSCPSTRKQLALAETLKNELYEMGAADVSLDENGYVMATIPSTSPDRQPVIGVIAHIDTSPDMSGANICPHIVENYDGGDITLNEAQKIMLCPAEFPELKLYIGQTLITTDGTTLLGADDKAGIAAIMCAAEYLLKHPELTHGAMRIAFTPDEEIGRGASHFDIKKFAADYAYTFDGGQLGELEYENFNAAEATVGVNGIYIHPGYAKGKMINALNVAAEFHSKLPIDERPETTENREGFFHLTTISGTEEQASMHYIIRDFDIESFEHRKKIMENIVKVLNKKYGTATLTLKLHDQYYNMKEQILPHFHIVDKAEQAMRRAGVPPIITVARGGTDGSRLSFMGLPCPNIFTGGHNPHGKYEFLSITSTQKAAEVILEIILC